jgi:hypothetical protein
VTFSRLNRNAAKVALLLILRACSSGAILLLPGVREQLRVLRSEERVHADVTEGAKRGPRRERVDVSALRDDRLYWITVTLSPRQLEQHDVGMLLHLLQNDVMPVQ